MARTVKKKKELTLEEKLAEALVPVGEQPYQVPENWCWICLAQIADLFNGDRGVNYPSKKDYVDKGIPFINAGAIQGGQLDSNEFNYITELKYNALRAGKIQKNDILYCLRGSLGKTAIVDFDSHGAISSSLCILRVKAGILVKYLFYLLNSFIIEHQQNGSENGSAQPNLSAASVLKYIIPLPPLPEQQRIVDRIESLFAKLDEAKEKAQAVVDGFEDRKAAILHKAFTGELTKEWRNERGFKYNFTNETLHDLCIKITDGFHNSPKPVEAGYPYVMAGNVQETGIDYYNGLFMDEKNHRELYNKAHPEKGDILIVNIGASTGRAAIIETDIEFSFKNCAILKLDKNKVNPKYILFFIRLKKDHWLKEVTRGGAQPFLSLKMLNQIEIPMVCLQEQNQVVETTDPLLNREQQAKEAAEQVISQIDTMKKSILARAFRGELGTNDPADESAVELLKRIL